MCGMMTNCGLCVRMKVIKHMYHIVPYDIITGNCISEIKKEIRAEVGVQPPLIIPSIISSPNYEINLKLHRIDSIYNDYIVSLI